MKTCVVKILSVSFLGILMMSCKSQMEISLLEYDSDVFTEWVDGKLWAYKSDENNTVGMTVYPEKDDYGKYYQISLFIMNTDDKPIIFDPAKVSAKLAFGRDVKKLNVYTNEEYQKMVTRKQRRDMILYGVAAGLNAGSAGYSTTYVNGYAYTTYNPSVASLASMTVANQLSSMQDAMEYEKRIKKKRNLEFILPVFFPWQFLRPILCQTVRSQERLLKCTIMESFLSLCTSF